VKAPCEYIVKYFLPALRAVVAEGLIECYGLSETEVAKVMGLSQPAVSYYRKAKRGTKMYRIVKENRELHPLIAKLTEVLYSGDKEGARRVLKEICCLARDIGLIPLRE